MKLSKATFQNYVAQCKSKKCMKCIQNQEKALINPFYFLIFKVRTIITRRWTHQISANGVTCTTQQLALTVPGQIAQLYLATIKTHALNRTRAIQEGMSVEPAGKISNQVAELREKWHICYSPSCSWNLLIQNNSWNERRKTNLKEEK